MKQSLQLRIGQHLAMTPQLQQAIRLLQLSTLELRTEIQQTLESNPLLEQVEDASVEAEDDWQHEQPDLPLPAAAEASAGGTDDGTDYPSTEPASRDEGLQELSGDSGHDADIPEDLPIDSSWEDTYDSMVPITGATGEGEAFDFDSRDSSVETLRDHLLWQMELTPFSERDRAIAMAIIDAINDDGYLSLPLEEILQAAAIQDTECELDEVEAVLHRIQNFDPPGIAARDLRECLLIQMQSLPAQHGLELARRILQYHFELLGKRDLVQLLRAARCTQPDLEQALRLIQSLNPRPGGQVAGKAAEYVVPDVVVRKIGGRWRIDLNAEALPRLRINRGYAGMVRRADNSADNVYLKNHLQEARWFLKSLQSRNETLLKVASCIVDQQREFLERGEEAMKPMVLHDVAAAINMHESTISRVTTQKFMHTPRGIYELKYFFSSHVGTDSGGECSATAIRALIKKLIAEEDVRKPLSDSKLALLLKKQGINVARRTVAKYREALGVASSSDRKRLI
ncbi:MAG: RNA polymerase factor sigma-54 [Gammaproteobacteria bacterium]|nr:RNA polymerase factor sigma-54 [Gammaproteobacteria bacterium]